MPFETKSFFQLFQNSLKSCATRVSLLKFGFGAVAIASLATSLVGCNLLRSGAHQHNEEIKLAESNACAIDVRHTFKNYVDGTANPDDVKGALACLNHDIEQFKLKTRSSTSKELYSVDEMTAFFSKYFSDTKELSASSLKAYMKFKNFVLGGGESQISKAELTVLENLITDASPLLSEMSQYISIYKMQGSLNLDLPQDSEKMERAINSVHKLSVIINKYFPGQSGAIFKFTDLDTLDFVQVEGASLLSNSEAVQLIMNLKSILVNPPDNSIKGEDFKHFMVQLDLILETGLRIKYTRDLKLDRDEIFLKNVEKLRNSTVQVFQNSFGFQKTKSIPYNELVLFLKKLEKYNLIPYGFKEKSVEDFLPVLMSKVLAKEPMAKIPATADLNFRAEHLDVALDAINEWIAVQKSFLSALTPSRDEITAQELIESVTQTATRLKDPKLVLAFTQLKEVLSNGVFLRWKDKDRLNFAPRSIDQRFTRYDLLFLSTSFSVIRQVMRSHINTPDRRANVTAMTEAELTDLYMNVREMGKDLKFIDTRNRLAPSRAFLENNIFTSVSNGNDFVEFHEALEWFYQVWSAGNMGLKIYEMVPEKCKTQELDVFEHRKLDHACYTAFFKEHVREFFDYLPTVSVYLNQILNNQVPPVSAEKASKKDVTDPWLDFDISLENAFRPTAYTTADFDSPDTEAMALILSYTESVFINHSHAHNGELDTTDIWATYPLMRGFIERASNGAAKTEFIKKTAFSYLITFGEIPSSDNLMSLGKFGAWTVLRNFHKETAHVPEIIKMISSFSLSSKNSKIKAAEAYYNLHKDTIENDVRNKNAKTIADLKEILFCSDEITTDLANKLSENSNLIFTRNPPVDATSFHKSIEKMIVGDSKLTLECLPFE